MSRLPLRSGRRPSRPRRGRALLARAAAAGACAVTALLGARAALAEPYYLIVSGLGGQPDYEKQFVDDAKALASAARRTVGDESRVKVLTGSAVSRESIKAAFAEMAKKVKSSDSAIVFLIGHGSYDGDHYKFNIPGPDVDGDEIGRWLAAAPARAQLIVDATSASGAALEKWATGNRTVITATRSGAERNATRFGTQWAAALSSKEADTNKDDVITAQEAFDFAARKVADSYKSEGTLATEHPQIKGEEAAHFTVARLTARGERTPEVAAMYSKLGDLEGRIEALRQRREAMDQQAYLNQLQALLVQLATVQQQIDTAEGKRSGAPAGQTAPAEGASPAERTAPTERTAPAGQTPPAAQDAGPDGGGDAPQGAAAPPEGSDRDPLEIRRLEPQVDRPVLPDRAPGPGPGANAVGAGEAQGR